MKRLYLPLICLALMATPSFAQHGAPADHDGASSSGSEFQDTGRRRGGGNDAQDRPVAPVPEPGTMALASMGLIALGAAARFRRNR